MPSRLTQAKVNTPMPVSPMPRLTTKNGNHGHQTQAEQHAHAVALETPEAVAEPAANAIAQQIPRDQQGHAGARDAGPEHQHQARTRSRNSVPPRSVSSVAMGSESATAAHVGGEEGGGRQGRMRPRPVLQGGTARHDISEAHMPSQPDREPGDHDGQDHESGDLPVGAGRARVHRSASGCGPRERRL